jgi:hypothetical protein
MINYIFWVKTPCKSEKKPDVLEEHIASFPRVVRSAYDLLILVHWSVHSSILQVKAISFSEIRGATTQKTVLFQYTQVWKYKNTIAFV